MKLLAWLDELFVSVNNFCAHVGDSSLELLACASDSGRNFLKVGCHVAYENLLGLTLPDTL